MLSAKDIAVIKIAVETCNNPELKKEILCTSESEYYLKKRDCHIYNKELWDGIIVKKATIMLTNLGLPVNLGEKLVSIVHAVGMRMLTWARYHECNVGLSREYSINFLNNSFFTQRGIIDNKKAAEELMKDQSLSIKQKYKLACLYCFSYHIPALFRQIRKKDTEEFYDAQNPRRVWQPRLVMFWSYYLMGEIDKLREDKNIDLYGLEMAIRSGNKVAVEYFLEKIHLSRNKCALIDAALEAVRSRTYAAKDWIAFQDDSKYFWVPNDYYVDILCFMLSKMREDQQVEFLKKDIQGVGYGVTHYEHRTRSRVLECFLNWPYQDYFMNAVKLMWEFLPKRNYAVLLLRICDKIESEINYYLENRYGEENSYNYRELLKEFWSQSPEHYKTFVFSNRYVRYVSDRSGTSDCGAVIGLLIRLLTLKKFTYEDRNNIKMILSCAIGRERETIASSEILMEMCVKQIKEENWEKLDRFVLNSFLSKEETDNFKRKLSLTKKAQQVCIDFVKNNKWNAADFFIKWSSLPGEEVNKLKIEMIYSGDGMSACVDLFRRDKKFEAVDKFIRWYVSSEENVTVFKKELVSSSEGAWACVHFLNRDEIELADEFIKFGLSYEEEIRELKKNVAYRIGSLSCEFRVTAYSEKDIYGESGHLIGTRIDFNEDRWVHVEQLLTWCFASEEEINEFKKGKLLKEKGSDILFKLIEFNQWEEAEIFFAWLGLSAEEIKELKKDTLFNHDGGAEMFTDLMYSEEGKRRFVKYGSKQEAIELLLRWFLTDEETVLEFKDKFTQTIQTDYKPEYDDDVAENFYLLIEQRLKDLDEEKMRVKRKSENTSPNKRLCNLKLGNTGLKKGH